MDDRVWHSFVLFLVFSKHYSFSFHTKSGWSGLDMSFLLSIMQSGCGQVSKGHHHLAEGTTMDSNQNFFAFPCTWPSFSVIRFLFILVFALLTTPRHINVSVILEQSFCRTFSLNYIINFSSWSFHHHRFFVPFFGRSFVIAILVMVSSLPFRLSHISLPFFLTAFLSLYSSSSFTLNVSSSTFLHQLFFIAVRLCVCFSLLFYHSFSFGTSL